jgi:hypothetical protein
MAEMTMIEALEKLTELNDYNEILVQTNAGEPKAIDFAIDDIRNYANERLSKTMRMRLLSFAPKSIKTVTQVMF